MFLLNYVILSALHLPGKTGNILLLSLASPVCISFFTRFLVFESETPRFRFHKPHLLFPAKSPSDPSGKAVVTSQTASSCTSSYVSSSITAPKLSFLKLLEESLSDASAAILQVGGYVILFSALLKLGIRFRIDQSLPGLMALSSLEITTGIQLLTQAPAFCRIPCVLFLTGFGGVCALFQSAAMIRDSGLSFFPYIIEKLATGLVTSLLTFLFL